jgi:preprotein translocase subunit YajC
MDVNYVVVALAVLGIILLIVFLIRRNNKDRRDFEKQLNDTEIKPDQHTVEKK